MESSLAIRRLSALAQDNRLAVFRLLVRAGAEGMPAGEIARRLGIPANTLSAQLTILARADLIDGRREGRSVIYTANIAAMSTLLVHLMADCCEGRPEICVPVVDAAAALELTSTKEGAPS